MAGAGGKELTAVVNRRALLGYSQLRIGGWGSPALIPDISPIYAIDISLRLAIMCCSIALSTNCCAAMMAVQQEDCNEGPFDCSFTGL